MEHTVKAAQGRPMCMSPTKVCGHDVRGLPSRGCSGGIPPPLSCVEVGNLLLLGARPGCEGTVRDVQEPA